MSDFKSRNTQNEGLSVNASMFNEQYGSVTRVRNPSKMFSTVHKEPGSFMFKSPKRSTRHSPQSNRSTKTQRIAYEENCQKLTMFLKTLEMLALHWKIINPNSFRYRLKNIPGVKKEMASLPKLV